MSKFSKEAIETLALLAFENKIKKSAIQLILKKMSECKEFYNIPEDQQEQFYNAINLNFAKWVKKYKPSQEINDNSLDLMVLDNLIK